MGSCPSYSPLPRTHSHPTKTQNSCLVTILKTIVPNNNLGAPVWAGGNLPSIRSSDSLEVSRKSARFLSYVLETFETLNRQRTKVTGNSKLSMLADTSPGTNVMTTYRKFDIGAMAGQKAC